VSFDQLFIIAITITASMTLLTALMAARELRSRRIQPHGPQSFIRASGLMNDDDDARGVGQNAELLHSISRLG
jgi:hypothetical protein